GIERTRLQWKVFLQQSNAFDLARRERRVVAIAVSFRSVRALELAERRQRANALALRSAAENVDRLLDAELRRRRDGNREPQVQIVIAAIVLRDARMRVDDVRRLLDVIVGHLRGHEARAIAESAHVEVRAELLDDPFALEPLGALD